ncbi:hypothetical protein Q5H93_06285 [Hymenobacter sp. ASUV-10]|uniref:Tail fiber protein n=1 Tax=Hymenobacter aranciens TaxID=3063996 RepID=A0ABT9B7T2_9BACT|nr:hypothetical protein [Hymenobacter sp. ASUV-10]MDO7874334.1 hypothetical protein [Hymenobacter sp. ASUV-10]
MNQTKRLPQFPPFSQTDHPYKEGEGFHYTFPNGDTRLFLVWNAVTNGPNPLPFGVKHQPNYVMLADPLTPWVTNFVEEDNIYSVGEAFYYTFPETGETSLFMVRVAQTGQYNALPTGLPDDPYYLCLSSSASGPEVVQASGQSTAAVMSQKATTDAINGVQAYATSTQTQLANLPAPTLYSATGQNTNGAMTQKATTDALDLKADRVNGRVPFTQLPAGLNFPFHIEGTLNCATGYLYSYYNSSLNDVPVTSSMNADASMRGMVFVVTVAGSNPIASAAVGDVLVHDGTRGWSKWAVAANGPAVVQATGTSATSVMSQNAITQAIQAVNPMPAPLTGYSIATTQSALQTTDTLVAALGKLEKKANDAVQSTVAYTQRAAPDTASNKIRFDKNAHYARTTSAITAAHYDLTGGVAGVTVRVQYYGTTAPVIPYGSFIISGAFISGRENVIYITYIPALLNTNNAATNPGLEFTISQY